METAVSRLSGQGVRLTDLAHGGGCGCKLAPSVLQELLAGQTATAGFPQLLVGADTTDDAAVWQIDDNHCIVATTDFFMPMVDDPHDFGRIAATNAISDIYAMGATPIMALAILGMPLDKLPVETVRAILAGGRSVCEDAGIPVAGGHSIDAPEPIYGLAVIGLCRPEEVRRNDGVRPGDALILTKGLGVGIYSSAFKKGRLSAPAYAELIGTTTLLNKVALQLSRLEHVHAITDVTGFGILGHSLEMARGSGLTLTLDASALPVLEEAEELARAGCVTGASHRNWASYGKAVVLPDDMPEWRRHLLTDPQTSGGLLVACEASRADEIIATIVAAGFPLARQIGQAEAGAAEVRVTLG